jgi:hypothetical protein
MIDGAVAVGFCDGGSWSAAFGLAYRDLCLADLGGSGRIVRPGGVELRKVAGAGGIASARNEIVRQFLDRAEAEWLWMVDTDMVFAPDVADRLVEAADPVERPVVGGLCFALKEDGREGYVMRYGIRPTLYDYVELPDEVGFRAATDYPRDELVRVAGTGAACLLIHRSALERVRDRYGDIWFEPATHPTGDHGKPRVFSEDLSFCVRLAAVGVPVHVHTGVKTAHDKGGVFLDETAYNLHRQARG